MDDGSITVFDGLVFTIFIDFNDSFSIRLDFCLSILLFLAD